MFRAFVASLSFCLLTLPAQSAPIELGSASFTSNQIVNLNPSLGPVTDVTLGFFVGPSPFDPRNCGDTGVIGCGLSLPLGDTGTYRFDGTSDPQFASFTIDAQFPLTNFFTVPIVGGRTGGPIDLGRVFGPFTPVTGTPPISFVELELTTNSLTPGPSGSDTGVASFAGTFRIFAEMSSNPPPVPLPASAFFLLVGLIAMVGLQKLRLVRIRIR